MMKQTNTRGFTLIELLVVIAIIGILASVVLASLNTARDKGEDASAQGSLSAARAEAELYYDSNNRTYTTVCTTGTSNIAALLTAAGAANGSTPTCVDIAGAWAASIQMTSNATQYFCVDSTGYSGKLGANPVLTDANTTCL